MCVRRLELLTIPGEWCQQNEVLQCAYLRRSGKRWQAYYDGQTTTWSKWEHYIYEVSGLPVTMGEDALLDFLRNWKAQPVRTWRQGWRHTWLVRAVDKSLSSLLQYDDGLAIIKVAAPWASPPKSMENVLHPWWNPLWNGWRDGALLRRKRNPMLQCPRVHLQVRALVSETAETTTALGLLSSPRLCRRRSGHYGRRCGNFQGNSTCAKKEKNEDVRRYESLWCGLWHQEEGTVATGASLEVA